MPEYLEKDNAEHPAISLFYAYDDFVVFAQKLGLVETRYKRILQSFVGQKEAVFSRIDRSTLPDECKQLYKEQVRSRVSAISYSCTETMR